MIKSVSYLSTEHSEDHILLAVGDELPGGFVIESIRVDPIKPEPFNGGFCVVSGDSTISFFPYQIKAVWGVLDKRKSHGHD